MGFPTKNDHFGVFWGYHHLRKHPYTYSVLPVFFVGFPQRFSGFVMSLVTRREIPETGGRILPNKGGSVGRRDHDLPYVKWNIYIYRERERHLHMMLAFQIFHPDNISINVRILPRCSCYPEDIFSPGGLEEVWTV